MNFHRWSPWCEWGPGPVIAQRLLTAPVHSPCRVHSCRDIQTNTPSMLFPQKKLEILLHKAILQAPPSLSACAWWDSSSALFCWFLLPSLGSPILYPNFSHILYGITPSPVISSLRLSSAWLDRLLARILHNRENSTNTTFDLVSFKGIFGFCIPLAPCICIHTLSPLAAAEPHELLKLQQHIWSWNCLLQEFSFQNFYKGSLSKIQWSNRKFPSGTNI